MFLSRRRNVVFSTPADKLMRRLRERRERDRIHREKVTHLEAGIAVHVAKAMATGCTNIKVVRKDAYNAEVFWTIPCFSRPPN